MPRQRCAARSVFCIFVLRDAARARKDVERTLSLNPSYPPAYENLGLVNMLEGTYGAAADSPEKAVAMSESDPLLPTRLFMLAVSLACGNRQPDAREVIERAIQLSPSPRSFHLLHAYCCRAEGDDSAAAHAESMASELPRIANAFSPRPPLPDEMAELGRLISPF